MFSNHSVCASMTIFCVFLGLVTVSVSSSEVQALGATATISSSSSPLKNKRNPFEGLWKVRGGSGRQDYKKEDMDEYYGKSRNQNHYTFGSGLAAKVSDLFDTKKGVGHILKPSDSPRITKWWPHFDVARDYKPKSAETGKFVEEKDNEMAQFALMKDEDDADLYRSIYEEEIIPMWKTSPQFKQTKRRFKSPLVLFYASKDPFGDIEENMRTSLLLTNIKGFEKQMGCKVHKIDLTSKQNFGLFGVRNENYAKRLFYRTIDAFIPPEEYIPSEEGDDEEEYNMNQPFPLCVNLVTQSRIEDFDQIWDLGNLRRWAVGDYNAKFDAKEKTSLRRNRSVFLPAKIQSLYQPILSKANVNTLVLEKAKNLHQREWKWKSFNPFPKLASTLVGEDNLDFLYEHQAKIFDEINKCTEEYYVRKSRNFKTV